MTEERRRDILAQVFREQNKQECDGALFGENHKCLVAMRRAEAELLTVDDAMVSLCLDAFEAMGKNAATCRKFLKKDLGIIPGAYAGSGQKLVSAAMIERLRSHLNLT